MSDLFAPDGGWRVRILDLSGGAQDNIVEEVGGFRNADAGQCLRSPLCARFGGALPRAWHDCEGSAGSWFAFGEDAEVIDAGDAGWRSATELGDFVDHPAGAEDRDWRALDPRRIDDDDDG